MTPPTRRLLRAVLLVLAALSSSPVLPAGESGARDGARVFISGHSLTDQPLPTFMARIAGSLGTPMQWNRQYMVGSAIEHRTRGEDSPSEGWAGYRQGDNREGAGLDVIAELRAPRTIAGRYDTLLITEQHGLLGSLTEHDTVRYLRHYHDRFIEGNAEGQTWFYEPWFHLSSKDAPRRWIDYERRAAPLWQCVATRINLSLAAEGRKDRIASLPAGLALAELIARATEGDGLPGVSGASVRETVDRYFHDDVHLTRLGSYYMALVSYAAIFRRSPQGAWAPEEVGAETAAALQAQAWGIVAGLAAADRPLTLEQCRERMREDFIGRYLAYVRDSRWVQQIGAPHAWLRSARRYLDWQWRFARHDADNPYWFDRATDRGVWLPPP